MHGTCYNLEYNKSDQIPNWMPVWISELFWGKTKYHNKLHIVKPRIWRP